MFLELNHQKLDVYIISREFIKNCYKITRMLPSDERFALTGQIRRAAVSVHLNIAEGASRFSKMERKRFYEIARSSVIEVDAAMDIAVDLTYFTVNDILLIKESTIKLFKMLTGMIMASY